MSNCAPKKPEATGRDRWRRELLDTALRHAWLLGLCAADETQITSLPAHVQGPLISKLRELLDWACGDAPTPAGRTREQHCDAQLWDFLKPFRAREFDGPAPLE